MGKQVQRRTPQARQMYTVGKKSYDKADYPSALANFTLALQRNPKLKGLYEYRGRTLMHLERFEEVVEDLEESLSLNPRNADTYINLAMCFATLRDWDAAESAIKQGIAVCPKDGGLFYQLALVQEHKGSYTLARKAYERSVELDPNNAAAWINLGNIHYNIAIRDESHKRLAKAKICYQRALLADPENAPAMENLASLYAVLDDPAKRKAMLAKLMLRNPEAQSLKEINCIDRGQPYSDMNTFLF